MKHNEFGIVSLLITKQEIEEFNFDFTLYSLEHIHKTPRKYFNKLYLTIDGYDNENREIYEIEEVRRYIQFLDKSFPYWFYYFISDIPKTHAPHKLLASCICEIDSVENKGKIKQVGFNLKSLQEFISAHFHYMNQIMEKENYHEDDIKTLSFKIIEIFS